MDARVTLFKAFHRRENPRPLIIWGDIPTADLDWLFAKLPPQGLAIITVVNTPEQARELWSKYAAHT